MREPSIHISKSIMVKLLDEALSGGVKVSSAMEPLDHAQALVSYILKRSKKYSLRHRSLLAKDERSTRRANRIQSSSAFDAGLLGSITRLIRTKAGHKNLKVITEKDGAQWDFLLQATGLANEFCETYHLEKKEGYITYIQIAMKEMKPFAFNRFKSAHERIVAHYECMMEIEKDPNNDKTELMYDLYQQKVFEKTGFNMDYRNVPYEYVHFVRAAVCANEVGLHPKHYVIAQFEQLDFTNGYPTPSQLDTFKAKERAIRWATENDIVKREKQKKLNKAQLEFMRKMEGK